MPNPINHVLTHTSYKIASLSNPLIKKSDDRTHTHMKRKRLTMKIYAQQSHKIVSLQPIPGSITIPQRHKIKQDEGLGTSDGSPPTSGSESNSSSDNSPLTTRGTKRGTKIKIHRSYRTALENKELIDKYPPTPATTDGSTLLGRMFTKPILPPTDA